MAGFSFQYGGKTSAALVPTWRLKKQRMREKGGVILHRITRTDPKTGLAMVCEIKEYTRFPVVEWGLRLKNTSRHKTPIIENIRSLDVVSWVGQFPYLNYWNGDYCQPDGYEPFRVSLAHGEEYRFAPVGGRPTDRAWPYYNLEGPANNRGLIIVVGWAGQWASCFRGLDNHGVHITAGQQRTHFKLRPGEEVRTPLSVLMFYRGDRGRSQNLWRRWMLAHNLPRTRNGRLPPPMFTSCSGGFFPGLKCNEADERRFIDAYTQAGVKLDYWWMDAGWYPCGDGWPNVGTWAPDPARFPRGLKAVSDHAHANGMGLIVWFEPERVAPGTWLATNHPAWILGGAKGGLLNLGHEAARKWLTDHVDTLLTQQGIDLYRQDFNLDPLPYWRAHDSADRQGLTEIRHVEGYLAYWDELRRRHPGLLIDSCASGGRRNDLETLRRAVPLLRSDYQSFAGDPGYAPGNQGHTYGLSSWIPYYGQGVYYSDRQLLYAVRSHYCPAFGFCADVRKPGVDWALFRRVVEQWRRVAPCFLGDFYPLTPYRLDPDVWLAWQFDRPEAGEGLVQVFRRDESAYESARFRLHGLEPDARYAVTDLDEAGSREMTGSELLERGLPATLKEKPAAALLHYRRISGAQ